MLNELIASRHINPASSFRKANRLHNLIQLLIIHNLIHILLIFIPFPSLLSSTDASKKTAEITFTNLMAVGRIKLLSETLGDLVV
jgi:hypothetical protein